MSGGSGWTGAPVRWGVLGVADIAVKKVIPGLQRSPHAQVIAIASRDGDRARAAAAALGIGRAYGSYEQLLADPDVEAIYNPLPNHLHVPWSIRAMEAGKHVLCEKPLAMTADEARALLEVRRRTGTQIGEAFMVRTHPQWLQVRDLIGAGAIGTLELIAGHFSYSRRDPADIRSRVEYGGGALLDIGCYPITLSRWLFATEPTDVVAIVDRDPELGIDRLTSALLRFPNGQATFSCATQLVPHQRMQIFGTRQRIEIEIPFNAPPDRPCRIFIDDGSATGGTSARATLCPVVDQYTVQGEHFARAIRGMGDVPVSLEDAIANMAVIDALFRSGATRSWQSPSRESPIDR